MHGEVIIFAAIFASFLFELELEKKKERKKPYP
jgi:hypothetical protein